MARRLNAVVLPYKKTKSKETQGKNAKDRFKMPDPDWHFEGAVKNIEFLTAPFFANKRHRRGNNNDDTEIREDKNV